MELMACGWTIETRQHWQNGFMMLSNQEGEHGRRNNLSRVYRQGNQGGVLCVSKRSLASEHELNIPARVASLEAERDQRTGAYAILGLMCSALGAVISKVFWN